MDGEFAETAVVASCYRGCQERGVVGGCRAGLHEAGLNVVVYYAISCLSYGVMRHIILIAALLCVACSSALPSFKPYRMDIQQGNVVTSKMMLQLRPGMTKSQVRYIMGTPLIQDSFHRDRWDYFYQMRKGGKIIEQRRVIMEFENDTLKRVRGDVVPAAPGETSVEAPSTAPVKVEPQAPEKKGMLDKLMFWKKDEADKPVLDKAGEPMVEETKTPLPMVKEDPKAPTKVVPELIAPAAAPANAGTSSPAPAESRQSGSADSNARNANTAQPAAKSSSGNANSNAAENDDDLPPEGEPGYFERMLEKIGF